MIPQLLLEQILLGEKNACDYYDLYGKTEIEEALKALRESNEEILKEYPDLDYSKTDYSKNVYDFKSHSEKAAQKRSWPKVLSFILTAAACSLFVIFPLTQNNIVSSSNTGSVRLKGNKAENLLHLYKQNEDNIIELKNGDKAYENDVIQITYLSAENEYGFIFSFDGNGNITRHFPENTWQAQKLSSIKKEVPLEFSYKLDDAPDYECFVFISSKEQFELKDLDQINKKDLSINNIKKGKFLPKNCEESLFILNK